MNNFNLSIGRENETPVLAGHPAGGVHVDRPRLGVRQDQVPSLAVSEVRRINDEPQRPRVVGRPHERRLLAVTRTGRREHRDHAASLLLQGRVCHALKSGNLRVDDVRTIISTSRSRAKGARRIMSLLGIREFSRRVSRSIETIEKTGEPVILTRHGRPVVAVIPLDAEGFEDFVLSHVPEFSLSLKAADGELERGETRTRAELFGDDAAQDADEAERPRERRGVAC